MRNIMGETLEEMKYGLLDEKAIQCVKDADYSALLDLCIDYEIFTKDELLEQLLSIVGAIQLAKDLGYDL